MRYASALSGVLYAEDFDELPAKAVVAAAAAALPASAPVVVAPSFSLEELRAATEQAHEDGRRAGRLAAEELDSVRHQQALTLLAEQLRLAQDQPARIVEQGLDAITRAALSLLSTALPAFCDKRAEPELRALLQRVLPSSRRLPELNIRLHPSVRSAVEEEATTLLEGSGTRVNWIESSKMKPGDIVVAWQNGSALRDTAETCASIRDAVTALLDDQSEPLDVQ